VQDSELIETFKTVVPFLSALCGPGCEVLLHDLTNVDQSVVAIANGYHSGRSVGSPITDLAQQVINTGSYKTQDFLANYSGTGKGKDFISSTYFIKNEGRLIGLLCVNRDRSAITAAENALEMLKRQYNLQPADTSHREELGNPAAAILEKLITDTLRELGVTPSHMSRDDKVRAVRAMQSKGITGMKGAVSEIARALNVSEPTVYRYLVKA